MTAKQTKTKASPHEINQRLIDELRWYGKTVAVEGPHSGYKNAAIKARERWQNITQCLLDGDLDKAG